MISSNESGAKNKIKNETEQLLLKYKHGNNILMNTGNSKTNKLHKFVLNLSQRLDLRSLKKMSSFKTYLFITLGKEQYSIRTIKLK